MNKSKKMYLIVLIFLFSIAIVDHVLPHGNQKQISITNSQNQHDSFSDTQIFANIKLPQK